MVTTFEFKLRKGCAIPCNLQNVKKVVGIRYINIVKGFIIFVANISLKKSRPQSAQNNLTITIPLEHTYLLNIHEN